MRKKERELIIKDITKHEISTVSSLKNKWVQIVYDGILTQYEINRKGHVRNIETKHRLKEEISNSGYRRVVISIKGKHKKISLHRVLAAIFIKIPKKYTDKGYTQRSLEPNHLDGNKLNCDLSNLEWATPKENTKHAFSTGLASDLIGSNSHLSKITTEDAIKICKMLAKGKMVSDISNKLKISKSTILHIKNRECWNHISKDFVFPKSSKSIPYTKSDNHIHLICMLIEFGIYTDNEIANKVGVSGRYVNDIKLHKRRKSISQLYNF